MHLTALLLTRFKYLESTTVKRLVMQTNITAILLFALCFNAIANSNAQTVTLNLKNVPVQTVFKEVSRQTQISIVYNEDMLKDLPLVSINVINAPLQQVMNICLKDQPFTYVIENNAIVIKKKEQAKTKEDETPPPPPAIDVQGRVVDEAGNPVVGASVTVKGNNAKGVSTDENGYFILRGLDENAVLLISGVTIEPYEIKVSGKHDLATVTVKTKVKEAEEVIVNAGYYKVKDRERTGSISKVDAKVIEKQPVSNPLQALQGRVTGFQITQKTGVAGGGFDVLVRGQNSILNGNNPLYVINGVPFTSESMAANNASFGILFSANPLSSINPADIESIEVLKDADATAIYGSRGANGVVLITTKKGQAGETRVNVNWYQGGGKISRKLDLLNTEQYVEMRQEAFTNDGATPSTSDYDLNGTWDINNNVDWQKLLVGNTANTSNAQVSVSGGNLNTQFLFGGGYYRETTVFPGDFSYKKGSGTLNINHSSVNKKFKANVSVIYSDEVNHLPAFDLMQYILLPPNAPQPFTPYGKMNWANGTFNDNPFLYLSQKYKANTSNFLGNAVLSYDMFPFLQLKTNFGYNQINRDEIKTNPASSYSPFLGLTSASSNSYFSDKKINTWIIEPQLNYIQSIGKGSMNILIGSTFQENMTKGRELEAIGFNNDALIENEDAASMVDIRSSIRNQYKYAALFGRLNFNWDRKYFFNLTGRRDGSSRFGPDNRFANFGAIGAAWIFSNEHPIRNNIPWLSYGKLRSSYGSSGNDQIGDYNYLESWAVTDSYDDVPGIYPVRISNPDFAWERNNKFEAAIQLGVLNNRIMLAAGFFKNRSANQLVNYALPLSTGFSSIQDNLKAVVENKGWEVEISSVNFKSKAFTWSSSFNITFPRNKLISYPGLENSSYATIFEIGKPLTVQQRFRFVGVDATTGQYSFEDLDGDGNSLFDIPDDLQPLKSIEQRFYGGFHNVIQYKNFQLDFLFQFVKQTGFNYLNNVGIAPGGMSNQLSLVMDRWQKPGDNATVQKFTTMFSLPYLFGRFFGDFTISDASFIRLKNVSLSYSFPQNWIKRVKMHQAKIYLQGQNLLTFTKYKGADPETQSLFSIPTIGTLTAGINLTF